MQVKPADDVDLENPNSPNSNPNANPTTNPNPQGALETSIPWDNLIKFIFLPLFICNAFLAVALFLLHETAKDNSWLYAVIVLGHYIFLAKYVHSTFHQFNESWVNDFNSALYSIESLKVKLQETNMEAANSQNDADSDVHSMANFVDETRKMLESTMNNPEQALTKVKKLDYKVSMAADMRQARQYFSRLYLTGFVSDSDAEFISFANLVVLFKKAGVRCDTDMSQEQQEIFEIHTHPRCLQLLCTNLKSYSLNNQDDGSSYKSTTSIIFSIPPELHAVDGKGKKSIAFPCKVTLRVKYMGLPLEKEDQINNEQLADYYSKKKSLKKPSDPSRSPPESINTKLLWDNLTSGRDLVTAFKISQIMDGQLDFEKEFRFSYIHFSFLSKCRKSLDRTSTSPIPIGGNSQTRKLRYSPNLSESYNNNNNNNNNNKLNDIDEDLTTKAIQEKFPEFMKVIAITADVEAGQKLIQGLVGDPNSSCAINLNPENLDILVDSALGTVEVDKQDNRKITRLSQLEMKMADVVILDNTLGSDSTGRRWLVSTMVTTLLRRGFKGVISVLLDSESKQNKQIAQTLSSFEEIHCVLTKEDSPLELKTKIVVANEQTDLKGKINSAGRKERDRVLKNFKRGNSYQDGGDRYDKPSTFRIEKRESERSRRNTGDFEEFNLNNLDMDFDGKGEGGGGDWGER